MAANENLGGVGLLDGVGAVIRARKVALLNGGGSHARFVIPALRDLRAYLLSSSASTMANHELPQMRALFSAASDLVGLVKPEDVHFTQLHLAYARVIPTSPDVYGRVVAPVDPSPARVAQDLSAAEGLQLWIITGRAWGSDDDTAVDVWGADQDDATREFKTQILDLSDDEVGQIPQDGPGSVVLVNSFRIGQVKDGSFVFDKPPSGIREQQPERARGG